MSDHEEDSLPEPSALFNARDNLHQEIDWFITSYNDFVVDTEATYYQLLTVKNELGLLRIKYDKIHQQLWNSELQAQNTSTHFEILNKFISITSKANAALTAFESRQRINEATAGASQRPTSQNAPLANFQLPQILLPRFNGELSKWQAFSSAFTNIIGNQDNINDSLKFFYLRQSLSGEALARVEHIEADENGFQLAWNLLRERYDNKRLIAARHVTAIESPPTIKRNCPQSLRAFIDFCKSHITALEALQLGVQIKDLLYMHKMLLQLDTATVREWEKSVGIHDIPTIDKFWNFLESQCKIMEAVASSSANHHQGNVQQSTSNSVGAHSKPKFNQSQSNVQARMQVTTSSMSPCSFCNSVGHFPNRCNELLKLQVTDRWNAVRDKRLCYNCLKPFAPNHVCSDKLCTLCGKSHHTVLHRSYPQSRDTQPTSKDKVQKNIDRVIELLKNQNFHSRNSSLERSRCFRKLLTLMKQMDITGLRQLYSRLNGKDRRLTFLSLLSETSTDASVLFMCQLHHNGLLELKMYSKYLKEMPFNYKNSSEKVLKAWLTCHQSTVALGKANSIDQSNRAFHLAFAVLFNKVYKHQLKDLEKIKTDSTHKKSFLMKFIRSLYAEFESSKTTEQELNVLDVLKNALAGSATLLTYLNETVVHNKSKPIEVRISACQLTNGKTDSEYDEKVFMVFSPLLFDEEEHLVLRAMALDIIVQHLNGAIHLLQASIKHFKSSTYLYGYFYSYIEQLYRSSTSHSHRDHLKKLIANYKLLEDVPTKRSPSFVKFFSSPRNDGSSNKSSLYEGQELVIKHIADPVTSLPHLLQLKLDSFDADHVTNVFLIHIELNGVNQHLLANVLKNINQTIPMHEIPKLLKTTFDDWKTEGNVEIVLEKLGYVLKRVSHRLTADDGDSQKQTLAEKFWQLMSLGKLDYEELLFCRTDSVSKNSSKQHKCERNSVHNSIGLLHNEENVFVAENGFTVMQSYFTPYYFHLDKNESISDAGLDSSSFVRLWLAKEKEFSVYDPMLSCWTGLTELHTTQLQMPFNIEAFNVTNKHFKVVLVNNNDSLKSFLLETKTNIYNYTEHYELKNNFHSHESVIGDDFSRYYFDNLESNANTIKHEFENIGLELSIPKNSQDCSLFYQALDIRQFNWTFPHALFGFSGLFSGHAIPGKCNFKMASIPSESSTKISIDLKVNGRYTDSHPLSGKQLNIQGNVTLIGDKSDDASVESVPVRSDASVKSQTRSYTFDTNFTSSANDVSTEINTRLKYYTGGVPDGNDYLVTFSKQFPPLGADVLAYGWADETVHTRLLVVSCTSGDTSCTSGNISVLNNISCASRNISCASDSSCASGLRISFHIVGQISDEQKEIAQSNKYPYERCRQEWNQSVWKGPLLPRTWACYEAALRLFYTRKVTLDAEYMNVPKYIEDLAVKTLNSLNGYISNYQQTNSTETSQKTSDGKVKVSIVHNATVPKFNLNLSLPIGSFHFKDVPGIDKDIYNIQLDNTHFSKAIQFFESTALVRSCIANAESVLTPDNATTQHTFNSSYDLLTSTFDRKFAVLAKKSADGMAVKVLVGNLSLEITPTYTELNGNQIENLENGFEFPKGEPYYMFRIWRNRGQVTVYSKVLLFYLIQSPVSITLDMPVIYLGQVQGLCGNLD